MLQRLHLLRDLVGTKEIIGVQPLDILPLADRVRVVSRRRSSLILLSHYLDLARCEPPSDGQRVVARTVIHDDDFLVGP